MLYMKLFLLNFNDFTINENVLGSVGGVQRKCWLKLFGLVFLFLREEILS